MKNFFRTLVVRALRPFMAFVAGAALILSVNSAFADPPGNPPGGSPVPTFSGINITGSSGDVLDVTSGDGHIGGDLVIDGTITAGNLGPAGPVPDPLVVDDLTVNINATLGDGTSANALTVNGSTQLNGSLSSTVGIGTAGNLSAGGSVNVIGTYDSLAGDIQTAQGDIKTGYGNLGVGLTSNYSTHAEWGGSTYGGGDLWTNDDLFVYDNIISNGSFTNVGGIVVDHPGSQPLQNATITADGYISAGAALKGNKVMVFGSDVLSDYDSYPFFMTPGYENYNFGWSLTPTGSGGDVMASDDVLADDLIISMNGIQSVNGTIYTGIPGNFTVNPLTPFSPSSIIAADHYYYNHPDYDFIPSTNVNNASSQPWWYPDPAAEPDLYSTDDLFVDDNAYIHGNLMVDGTITGSGLLPNPLVLGSTAPSYTAATNDIAAQGNVYAVGNVASNSMIFTKQMNSSNYGDWVSPIGDGDIAAQSDLWARGGLQVLDNVRSATGKIYTGAGPNHDFTSITGIPGDGDIVSTNDVFADDNLYVDSNSFLGGALEVNDSSNLKGTIYNSTGALVLNDEVQVGLSGLAVPGLGPKLYTGPIASLAYGLHASFGHLDIASSDDLFADDDLFVGDEIEAAKIHTGSPTASVGTGDIVADDDLIADDDITAGDDISAGGTITATDGIGLFYSKSGYVNMDQSASTVVSVSLGCNSGDVVVACSGRTEDSGAEFMGAKPVSSANICVSGNQGNSSSSPPSSLYCSINAPGCTAYGRRGTAASGTDLNVYTFCFSPNG